MHHAALPKFSLGRDEKEFVAGHASPIDRLTSQQALLILQDRLVGVDFFAALFSLDHRVNERFQFLFRPAFDAETAESDPRAQSDFRGNPARQTSLENRFRFGQSILRI